jgi:hypothetical protein
MKFERRALNKFLGWFGKLLVMEAFGFESHRF